MGSLWEILVVIAIVGAAVFWLIRSIWKAVRAKKVCATCGDAASCPLVQKPELVDQLVGIGDAAPGSTTSGPNPDGSNCPPPETETR